jgi:hypothetical protein
LLEWARRLATGDDDFHRSAPLHWPRRQARRWRAAGAAGCRRPSGHRGSSPLLPVLPWAGRSRRRVN